MNINIKATNIELTDAISGYVITRLDSIKKFIKEGEEMTGYVEVGKMTKHHNKGDIYKAEFDIQIGGERNFIVSEKDDLYSAIDCAKEEIINKIVRNHDRKKTLFKRGSISIKKMMKGISDRNPFTSKK